MKIDSGVTWHDLLITLAYWSACWWFGTLNKFDIAKCFCFEAPPSPRFVSISAPYNFLYGIVSVSSSYNVKALIQVWGFREGGYTILPHWHSCTTFHRCPLCPGKGPSVLCSSSISAFLMSMQSSNPSAVVFSPSPGAHTPSSVGGLCPFCPHAPSTSSYSSPVFIVDTYVRTTPLSNHPPWNCKYILCL